MSHDRAVRALEAPREGVLRVEAEGVGHGKVRERKEVGARGKLAAAAAQPVEFDGGVYRVVAVQKTGRIDLERASWRRLCMRRRYEKSPGDVSGLCLASAWHLATKGPLVRPHS